MDQTLDDNPITHECRLDFIVLCGYFGTEHDALDRSNLPRHFFLDIFALSPGLAW